MMVCGVIVEQELRILDVDGGVGRLYRIGCCFFFKAEEGIRDFCLSRGLGDVNKGQLTIRFEFTVDDSKSVTIFKKSSIISISLRISTWLELAGPPLFPIHI